MTTQIGTTARQLVAQQLAQVDLALRRQRYGIYHHCYNDEYLHIRSC
jgi:hypothetical protein